MNKIVTFGEIMGRIEAEHFSRLIQSLPGQVRISFGGAEANVASSLAYMGRNTQFVTALPDNVISKACLGFLRSLQVDVSEIKLREEGRFGLYFIESGANQRPSNVLYDREHSTISVTDGSEYNWDNIFKDAIWFHLSGTTPAISKTAAEASLLAVQKAKEYNVTVSCDMNFRNKLWKWDPNLSSKSLAEKVMRSIIPFVDVLYGNEEDASDTLNISCSQNKAASGVIDMEFYQFTTKEIINQFPHIKYIAFTLRESISASHNNWSAILYDAKNDKFYTSPLSNGKMESYQIRNIVDRVGGGDSFGAGLIYAFTDTEFSKSNQTILDYATAASCLCHSIRGDINFSSKEEVVKLMTGDATGRVVR